MKQSLISSLLDFLMAGGVLLDVDSELPFSDNNEDYDLWPQPSRQVVKLALSGADQ